MKHCNRLLFCLIAFLMVQPVWAQEKETEADSLMSYDLAEIVVQSGTQRDVQVNTMQRVSLAGIAQTDAASVDQVMRLVPAASVQTNSRGETLVYLRGAGERQVALFFDGALLNVPWDNRFDLALLPSGVLGSINVAKGVPSVLYGTNVLGGAINMTTRTLGSPGRFTEVNGMVGTPGFVQGRLTQLGRTDNISYTFSAGYTERDGLTLPEDADLPFSQSDSEVRTNTDRQLFNLFGQASYQFNSGAQVGVALLHFNGEKGIAPESHLNPEASRVRYWRYPDYQTSMLIVNGTAPLGAAQVRGAVWGNRFTQTIDQYASMDYSTLAEVQDDEDLTLGTRVTLARPMGAGEARVAINALTSQHNQINQLFDDDGAALPEDPEQTYLQHIWSVGGEYEWQVAPQLEALLGASLDGIATPKTGDKPARDPQLDYGVSAGLRYNLDDMWTLRGAAGRKVRFPTMRELFGEALGRFLVNPDLTAESSLLTEIGVGMTGPALSGEVITFYNRTYDTIDQRSVTLPGEDRSRRQRINLDGSRVYGVEIVGTARPLAGLSVNGHLTWTHVRAFIDGETRRLAEKPEWIGTVRLDYDAPGGFSVLLEPVLRGHAYSPDDDDVFQQLPTALILNARLGYRLVRSGSRVIASELFVRINNATDELVLPQLGLPGPGREVIVGIDLSF
ncbi:MAG TPA: TonB-dependent receptor [Rhodothermales bacterium]|nr:TonB-dependent receptor [Rhodothermales bacterium]